MTRVKMIRYYLNDETVKDLEAGTGIELISDKEKVTISAVGGGGGEINTSSNLGVGVGLAAPKSGVNLPFKSLIAGNAIVLNPTSTDVIISVDAAQVATFAQGAKADTAVQPGDLATVAFSGDYNDLINTPSGGSSTFIGLSDVNPTAIPNGYLLWNGAGTQVIYSTTIPNTSITGLATVASSGSYADLNSKPVIPTNLDSLTDVVITTPNTGNYLRYNGSFFVNDSINISDIPGLADVATTGSYTDLTNTPNLGSNIGDVIYRDNSNNVNGLAIGIERQLLGVNSGLPAWIDIGFSGNSVKYVSANGSDVTGNGSFNRPYSSLQAAHDSFGTIGTIVVLPGTYTGNLNVTKSILVQGYATTDSALVVIKGNITVNNGVVNFRMKDLQVQALTGTGPALTYDTTGGHSYIDNVTFEHDDGVMQTVINFIGSNDAWYNFARCGIAGYVNLGGTPTAGAFTTFDQCNQQTFKINQTSAWLTSIVNSVAIGVVNHADGLIAMKNILQIYPISESTVITSSANLAANTGLIMDSVNLFQQDGSIGSISKSGSCVYYINSTNHNINNELLLGTKLYQGNPSADIATTVRVDNNASVTATLNDHVVVCTFVGPRTVALPAGFDNKELVIKDGAGIASASNIVISTNGGQLIDGSSTYTISSDYGSVRIVWNGTQWNVI